MKIYHSQLKPTQHWNSWICYSSSLLQHLACAHLSPPSTRPARTKHLSFRAVMTVRNKYDACVWLNSLVEESP